MLLEVINMKYVEGMMTSPFPLHSATLGKLP